MSDILEFETDEYQFIYYPYYGTAYFVRNSDGYTSHTETGTDCQELRSKLLKLYHKYIQNTNMFKQKFNAIAETYEYYI